MTTYPQAAKIAALYRLTHPGAAVEIRLGARTNPPPPAGTTVRVAALAVHGHLIALAEGSSDLVALARLAILVAALDVSPGSVL